MKFPDNGIVCGILRNWDHYAKKIQLLEIYLINSIWFKLIIWDSSQGVQMIVFQGVWNRHITEGITLNITLRQGKTSVKLHTGNCNNLYCGCMITNERVHKDIIKFCIAKECNLYLYIATALKQQKKNRCRSYLRENLKIAPRDQETQMPQSQIECDVFGEL